MEEKKEYVEPIIEMVKGFDARICCLRSSADVDVKDNKQFNMPW